jgi:uncharacterized membrane protein
MECSFPGSAAGGFSIATALMVNKVLTTEYRRDSNRWGCVMVDLALGISMLAAGILGFGAVVVYALRYVPLTEHWGS